MGFPYPYPLGLPKGSVRATITLLLAVDLALLTLQNKGVAENVATMTVVALTFYFGGKMRGSAIVPRTTDRQERAWGLPGGSIRTLLIFIFAGTFVMLYLEGTNLPGYFIEVVNIILGYIVGRFFEWLRKILLNEHEKTGVGILDHLKSLAVLGITITTIYYTLFDDTNSLTVTMTLLTAALLGFYFGSRDHAVRQSSVNT